jgi:tetratricopeptide (TPR) repeat protein
MTASTDTDDMYRLEREAHEAYLDGNRYYYEKKAYKTALECYDKTISLNPRHIMAHKNRGKFIPFAY